jgi:hypothetical protein
MLERHVLGGPSQQPMFQPGQLVAPGAYYSQPAYPPGYPLHQQAMYGQLDRAFSNASSYGPQHLGPGMPGAAVNRQPSSNYGPSGGLVHPDPFVDRALTPLDEGEEPSRSGTPVNPNPQQTYYHRNIDSANVNNQTHTAPETGSPGVIEYVAPTRAHDEGWSEMRANRTLSVRNGGLDAAEFDEKRDSASSDAYGGIVRLLSFASVWTRTDPTWPLSSKIPRSFLLLFIIWTIPRYCPACPPISDPRRPMGFLFWCLGRYCLDKGSSRLVH